MRKFLFAILAFAALSSSAQVNLQLHYDLGRTLHGDTESERPNVTSTVEMFKADKLGNTFFFVDFDYYSSGVGSAYWEVSREFSVIQAKSSSFAAHVEYDGGLSISKGGVASRFQPCALAGPAWNWHNGDFSTTFSLQALFKQYFQQTIEGRKTPAVSSFQLTAVWGTTFANGKFTFSGFADLWRGFIPKWDSAGQKKGLVFLSEPQLWFNATENFSVGTEWELSKNFIYTDNGKNPLLVNPTIAVKYKF